MSCLLPGDVERHLRHFDALYAKDDDPWQARVRRDEMFKRRIVGYALGTHRHARGLEIGCGNGVSTRALARHFLRLVAVDGSAQAVASARAETASLANTEVVECVVPAELPVGPFDAIVASEVLYYLPARKLSVALERMRFSIRRGGLFVSTHHIRMFDDSEVNHVALVTQTRAVFGRELRQHRGAGWRCYVHMRR